jgi:hypothetical protein
MLHKTLNRNDLRIVKQSIEALANKPLEGVD